MSGLDFTVLQNRSIKVKCMALSPTMDICSVITAEDQLSTYRTLSWERIWTKPLTEVFDSVVDVCVTCVAFCPTGKVVSLGCTGGLVASVDIESVLAVSPLPSKLLQSTSAIESSVTGIAWLTGVNTERHTANTKLLQMLQGSDRDGAQLEPSEIFMCSLRDSKLMLCVSDVAVTAYLFGIFPLFSVATSANPLSLVMKTDNSVDVPFLVAESSRTSVVSSSSAQNDMRRALCAQLDLLDASSGSQLRLQEKFCVAWLQIKSRLEKAFEIMSTLEKKWKEVNKVIVAKFGLLATLLEAYELKMSPVEFLYTCAVAGKWHPCSSHFSQHWNDQGLARLKSEIDTCTNTVFRTLTLELLPCATNLRIQSRELYSCYKKMDKSSPRLQFILKCLIRSSEQLLFKVDDTVMEARRAREGLLSYLQFVKEKSIQQDSPEMQNFRPDLTLQQTMIRLLDPKLVRAKSSGPTAKAEAVCATHLYAYLQDQDLPSLPRTESAEHMTMVHTIFESVDSLERCVGEDDDLSLRLADLTNEGAVDKRSLLKQAKVLREIFESTMACIDDTISVNSSRFSLLPVLEKSSSSSFSSSSTQTAMSQISNVKIKTTSGVVALTNALLHVSVSRSSLDDNSSFELSMLITESRVPTTCTKLSYSATLTFTVPLDLELPGHTLITGSTETGAWLHFSLTAIGQMQGSDSYMAKFECTDVIFSANPDSKFSSMQVSQDPLSAKVRVFRGIILKDLAVSNRGVAGATSDNKLFVVDIENDEEESDSGSS